MSRFLFTQSDVHRLVTEWKIQKRVEEQFNAFITGFNELIPADLVNVFDERELELLIGGIADIDVEDWKKHTDYRGYQEQDEVIQHFWKVIRTWDAEQKSRLLQFATGTSRIPVNGFKDLQGSDGPRRFTIEKAGEINALPKSHTWYVSHPALSPSFLSYLFRPVILTSLPKQLQSPRSPAIQDIRGPQLQALNGRRRDTRVRSGVILVCARFRCCPKTLLQGLYCWSIRCGVTARCVAATVLVPVLGESTFPDQGLAFKRHAQRITRRVKFVACGIQREEDGGRWHAGPLVTIDPVSA
jgi:hypothetical protein